MRLLFIKIAIWGGILSTLSNVVAMNKSFDQGSSWAQSLPTHKPQNPQILPGYGGIDLPQSRFKGHDLGSEVQNAMRNNEASSLLMATSDSRQHYVIDSQKDPLIELANQAIADPQKTLDENIRENTGSEILLEETKTCIESGDEYIQSCSKQLVIKFKVTPYVSTYVAYCPGHEK
jgi:hypothetical protein